MIRQLVIRLLADPGLLRHGVSMMKTHGRSESSLWAGSPGEYLTEHVRWELKGMGSGRKDYEPQLGSGEASGCANNSEQSHWPEEWQPLSLTA